MLRNILQAPHENICMSLIILLVSTISMFGERNSDFLFVKILEFNFPVFLSSHWSLGDFQASDWLR